MDAQVCEASADQATRAESGATCEASTSDEPTLPLMADIIQALDEKLYFVISKYGFPVWITEGQGGNSPSHERHKFLTYRWKEGARVDFYRGRAEDDWMNVRWAALFEQLPHYRHTCGGQQLGIEGSGNAMEAAAGISFGCMTLMEYLPASHKFEWHGNGWDSRVAWGGPR